ncbi:MAG TPA: hypothetical protein VHI77_01320 [Solirubrobacterales bacterium]|nr:hypothetical protein [Solirubrobacterales bacterium]
MHLMQPIKGRMTRNYERPDWEPLIELAPEHVDDFMWMFELELENGVVLHAYKHWETRNYLHLDNAGRAFVYIWSERIAADDDGRYEQVDPEWLLQLVLDRERSASFVSRNVLSDYEKMRWARSASRHRVRRRAIREVIANCRLRFTEPPPEGAPAGTSERLVFVGDDECGRALEVMAVEAGNETLSVIHAMELRDRYRLDYEEAKRWQAAQ